MVVYSLLGQPQMMGLWDYWSEITTQEHLFYSTKSIGNINSMCTQWYFSLIASSALLSKFVYGRNKNHRPQRHKTRKNLCIFCERNCYCLQIAIKVHRRLFQLLHQKCKTSSYPTHYNNCKF